ncbi:hypothetical protein [Carbonactinospora thermoautotrophica]|uniref:hypothetical protein n=1 Tax=Carbonactinospora thermoautotrophica TaxID=1469144 RepID=UPI003DA7E0C7
MTKRRTLAAYVLGAAFVIGGAIPAFADTSTDIGPSDSPSKAATLGVLGQNFGEQELTGALQGFPGLTGGPAQGALRKGDGLGLPLLGGALPQLPVLSGGAPLRTQGTMLPENRLADPLPPVGAPVRIQQTSTPPEAAVMRRDAKAAPAMMDAATVAARRYVAAMTRVLVPAAVPARTAPNSQAVPGQPALTNAPGANPLPGLANTDLSGVRLPNPTGAVRVG